MYRRITLFLSLLLPSFAVAQIQQTNQPTRSEQPARAQTLTQIVPGIPLQESSFMIVVDDVTFDKCKSAIMDYKRALERDGLPTFVLSATWQTPDEVRHKLEEFHTHSQLEGAVLIGDIPVPMITTDRRPATAIESDRFYDCFDLIMEPLGQHDGKYYYHLANADRDQQLPIRSQIYAGRISALPDVGDPYVQINDYLLKVAAVYQEQNKLDQFVSYQGHSVDEVLDACLVAWHPQASRLTEKFPGVFSECGQARFLRYDFWENPTVELINQLRRPDLDLAVIYGQTGIETADIPRVASNARLLFFNSHSKDQITETGAQYLFATGQTVSVLANITKKPRTISSTHMMGLLGLGARLGQWAKYNYTLETKIIGDPAFRFEPTIPEAVNSLQALLRDEIPSNELKEIATTHPWPDVRSAALMQLYYTNEPNISMFLREQFEQTPYSVVRLSCMKILGMLDDVNYWEVLKQGTTDADELVRRTAISKMARADHPDFVPYLVRAYLENHYASAILSNLKTTLQAHSPSAVKMQSTNIFNATNSQNNEKSKTEFLRWAAQ